MKIKIILNKQLLRNVTEQRWYQMFLLLLKTLVLLPESSENLPLIVGVATAGGMTLAIAFIIAVVFLRRFSTHGMQHMCCVFIKTQCLLINY